MYKKILAAVDLGHEIETDKVLDQAHHLAQSNGAKLSVMTAVPDYGMSIVGSYFEKGTQQKMIDDTNTKLHKTIAAKFGQDEDNQVQHIVSLGRAYDEILAAAEKIGADLIVIGAHRPEIQDYLLGPNAARVARHANVSVHIVRT